MTVRELTREITLDSPREELFAFFAEAANLERITPQWLRFAILPPLPSRMEAGALIRYRLRLHGIPIRWTTRIAVWDPPRRFIDEQLRGPFRSWVHEHAFESVSGGTVMRDHIRYEVPGGALIDRLFVRPDLEKIFDYRQSRLKAHWGGVTEPAPAPQEAR